MAILLIKESSASDKLKSKRKNTTKLTSPSLFTSTLPQAQIRAHQQRRQHYHQEYHPHYNNNNKDNGDGHDEKGEQQQQQYDNLNDFYHVKQCYQPTKVKSINLLSQRKLKRNHHNNTNVITTAIRTRTYSTLSHVRNLPLLGNCCRPFTTSTPTILFIFYLLLFFHSLAMAAPQSCILCDKNDLLAKDPQTNYEEFLFEHQVTRQDAINALRQLNESFYEGMASDSSCNAVKCTDKVMKYCLGPQFINDHCWCELGHSTEGLPFVPHICYVGEKVYKASVGSCFFYEEVKECCCSSVLAKEWRHISAGSSVYIEALLHDYYMLAVIFLLNLLIRRYYI